MTDPTFPEFDPNKVAVEFLKQNLDSIFDLGKTGWKRFTKEVQLRLQKTYKTYITTVGGRYSKAKSFFIRSEPVPLYSFYIPIGASCSKTTLESITYKDLTEATRFAVITGSAGSGKSMLMRHLTLVV